MNKYLIFINLLIFSYIKPVIYIFTTAYNRPEFIELQHKTFNKFLKDDFEQIIFNDASEFQMEQLINNECAKYSIRCFRVPQQLHHCYAPSDLGSFLNNNIHSFTASFRHGDGLQFAFEALGFNHDDIVVTLDSDIFLVRDFSIREYLKDHQVSGVPLYKFYDTPAYNKPGYPFLADSPHVSMIFFDIPKMPDVKSLIFKPGMLSYAFYDTGNLLQYYFHSHSDIKFKHMQHDNSIKLQNSSREDLVKLGYYEHQINFIKTYFKLFENPNYKIYYQSDRFAFIANSFLDFGAGRAKVSFNEERFKLYRDYINSII